MRKFTPTEIDLCKKIAEKDEKERKVKFGDWYLTITTNPIDKNDKEESVYLNTEKRTIIPSEEMKKDRVFYNKYIPLWQEHDCLEWLNEKYSVIELWRTGRKLVWMCRLNDHKWWKGKTPLEALLRAVLAVMEGVR